MYCLLLFSWNIINVVVVVSLGSGNDRKLSWFIVGENGSLRQRDGVKCRGKHSSKAPIL